MQKKALAVPALITAMMMFSSLPVGAQPPPPPGPGSGGPIDGGVFTLLLGAVAYGYRKLKQDEIKED